MKVLSLAVSLVLALFPAQDKITLKFAPRKGDKVTKIEKSEMTIKAQITAGEQNQALDFAQRENQVSTLELVEVADGAVTKAVFTCKEDIEEKKGPQGPDWEKTEKPLHGKKITLSLADGKLVREGADGLDAKALKKLDLSDRTSRIFPKTPVGPGDTWEIGSEDVRAFLGADDDFKDGKIKVKFLSVNEVEGRKCATLNAVMDLTGKAENDVALTVKLDAEVVVWIERGYALSIKGKGTITMNASNDQFKMKGEGPMTLEINSKIE